LATITAIPDAYLQDSGFDAEGSVEAEFAAAMGSALDRAILFGQDRPSGFPELVSGAPATGADALAAIDAALSVVEASGVEPTGIAAGPMIGSALRQAYREVMAMPSQGPEPNVFGVPLRIVPTWPANAPV
jgi:Phage capsid family